MKVETDSNLPVAQRYLSRLEGISFQGQFWSKHEILVDINQYCGCGGSGGREGGCVGGVTLQAL